MTNVYFTQFFHNQIIFLFAVLQCGPVIFHTYVVISHFFLPAKMHASANKSRQVFYVSYLFFEQQWTSGWGLDMPFVT